MNWIAQDKDGEVCMYEKKPTIECNGFAWWTKTKTTYNEIKDRGINNPNWKDSLIDLSKNDYIIKDGILMATRKHAALIHAWADGAEIQYRSTHNGWQDCISVPNWVDTTEYRIKPVKITIRFKNYVYKNRLYVHKEGLATSPDGITWLDKDWREVEIEL